MDMNFVLSAKTGLCGVGGGISKKQVVKSGGEENSETPFISLGKIRKILHFRHHGHVFEQS